MTVATTTPTPKPVDEIQRLAAASPLAAAVKARADLVRSLASRDLAYVLALDVSASAADQLLTAVARAHEFAASHSREMQLRRVARAQAHADGVLLGRLLAALGCPHDPASGVARMVARSRRLLLLPPASAGEDWGVADGIKAIDHLRRVLLALGRERDGRPPQGDVRAFALRLVEVFAVLTGVLPFQPLCGDAEVRLAWRTFLRAAFEICGLGTQGLARIAAKIWADHGDALAMFIAEFARGRVVDVWRLPSLAAIARDIDLTMPSENWLEI